MSLERLWRLLRNLRRGRALDRELHDELTAYVEQLADERRAAGADPAEARRQARLELGGLEQVKEQVRQVRAGGGLEELGRDVRIGLRRARRAPAFTTAVVLTLAVGIGGATAIFSLVDTVWLRPLPYEAPNRLVYVWEGDGSRSVVAWTEFLTFVERSRTLAGVAAAQPVTLTLRGHGPAEQLSGALVSASLFPMLGVQPVLGRTFVPVEDAAGAGQAALISEALWRRAFGSDPGILGRPIMLDVSASWGREVRRGPAFTVVGVLPRSFQPLLHGLAGDVWLPLAPSPSDNHDLFLLGRMRDGVALAGVATELEQLAAPMQAELHSDNRPMRFHVVPLVDDLLGNWSRALAVALGAGVCLLLAASMNIASLTLARGRSRRRELALRVSLGASRGRLARQLLTETLVLVLIGATAALWLATWAVALLARSGPPGLPRLDQIGLDERALAFAAGATLLVAIVSALAPARRLAAPSLSDDLKSDAAFEQRPLIIRHGAVVLQVALAVVLMVGGSLMAGTLAGFLRVDPGFSTEDVLTFRVTLPAEPYGTREGRVDFHEGLFTRLRTLPDVRAAAINSALPFGGLATGTLVSLPGTSEPVAVRWQGVSPGYFRAIGIPLIGGRDFEPRHMRQAGSAVIVDRLMAERVWGAEDPVGRTLLVRGYAAPLTVIGLVAPVRDSSLEQTPRPTLYLPVYPQTGLAVVRSPARREVLIPAIRGVIASIDAGVAPSDFREMTERVHRTFALQRFTGLLLGGFAVVATLLGMVGLYGLVSFSVGRRAREIAVRRALGANTVEILRLVLGHGLRLAGAGLVIGLPTAAGLSQLLASLLFAVEATDVGTYLGVAAAISAVSLAACALPARRAARLDPLEILRRD
jgi:predicted permease